MSNLIKRNNFLSMEHGFTLLELIVVIIILGIFFAIAIPKFNNPVSYTTQSRAETFASDLRHINNLAVTGGRCIVVVVTASSGVTSIIGKKPSDVIYPPCNGNTTLYTSTLDSNTSISGPTVPLYFNSLGQPSVSATYTVVASGSTKYVGVNAFTGLVVICSSLPCP